MCKIIITLAVMADRKKKMLQFLTYEQFKWPETRIELGTSLTSDGNLTRCTRNKNDYGC